MKYLFMLITIYSFVNAHKVNLFISSDRNNIDIYSYFATGTACKNCTLIIKNKDKVLVHDKLNNRGKYQYESKFKTLKVIVDASSGHRVSENITIDTLEKENFQVYLDNQNFTENIKIILGIIAIFFIFYFLKRFKK